MRRRVVGRVSARCAQREGPPAQVDRRVRALPSKSLAVPSRRVGLRGSTPRSLALGRGPLGAELPGDSAGRGPSHACVGTRPETRSQTAHPRERTASCHCHRNGLHNVARQGGAGPPDLVVFSAMKRREGMGNPAQSRSRSAQAAVLDTHVNFHIGKMTPARCRERFHQSGRSREIVVVVAPHALGRQRGRRVPLCSPRKGS